MIMSGRYADFCYYFASGVLICINFIFNGLLQWQDGWYLTVCSGIVSDNE
jgi:hypothetical protein